MKCASDCALSWSACDVAWRDRAMSTDTFGLLRFDKTTSQPFIVALMTDLLDLNATDAVRAWQKSDDRDCLGRRRTNCGGVGSVASVRSISPAHWRGPRARTI